MVGAIFTPARWELIVQAVNQPWLDIYDEKPAGLQLYVYKLLFYHMLMFSPTPLLKSFLPEHQVWR